jgi:hypothetical protein
MPNREITRNSSHITAAAARPRYNAVTSPASRATGTSRAAATAYEGRTMASGRRYSARSIIASATAIAAK